MTKGTRSKAKKPERPEETERIQKAIVRQRGPLKYEIELNEEQKAAKRLILENQITILTGKAGSGKAQPLCSKILTPNGWITMGSIKKGDSVITQSGEVTFVTDIFPQGEKEIFKISFSDGSSTMCCKEHLWNVKDCKLRNKWRGPHNNLVKIETEYKTIELTEIIDNLYYNDRLNYSIPIVKPVQFMNKNLKLDPYFLGLILGDGGTTHAVTWSSQDEELIVQVENYVKIFGCTLNLKKQTGFFKEFTITSTRGEKNKILDLLREIDCFGHKSENKFIPDQYKFSSIGDRIALLQGLMDTDGSTTGISTSFHTSSPQLRDDVIELIRSLGGTATFNSKIPKYKYLGKILEGRQHYNLSIRLVDINPFRLKRKADKYINKTKYSPTRYITNIESIGKMEAKCISIADESHLYVTDDYIVTHNTLVAVITALDMLFKKEIKKIFITRPVVTREEIGFLPGNIADKMDPFLVPIYDNLNKVYRDTDVINKLIEDKSIDIAPIAYIRGRTIDNAVLIVDEAQNIDDESCEALLTRTGKTGKVIVCGDSRQIDLKTKVLSGLNLLVRMSDGIEGIAYLDLKKNHRSPLVEKIIEFYENVRIERDQIKIDRDIERKREYLKG